jgi:opacity protein-like surface antigen
MKNIWQWMSILIASFVFIPHIWAQNVDGKLGVGLRGGGGHVTQEVNEDVKARFGPVGEINVFYGASPKLLAGVELSWESYHLLLPCEGCRLGEATVVSVIPTVQYRLVHIEKFFPYVTLGLGINVNQFNESDRFGSTCTGCEGIDTKNTFAFKVGGGLDYFVTPNFALNGALSWKVNTSTNAGYDIRVGGTSLVQSDDYRLNVFSLLFGFRYFY